MEAYADGRRYEGEYVEGQKHGRWVETDADGMRYEGEYVEGERHGRWVEAMADGRRDEGEYVEGERHGRWVEAYPDGWRDEGGYVGGVKRGTWVETKPDGTRAEGEYVEGETGLYRKHGRWVTTRPDGTVWEQHWDKGTAVGDKVVRHLPPNPSAPPSPPSNGTHQQRPTGPILQSGPRARAGRPVRLPRCCLRAAGPADIFNFCSRLPPRFRNERGGRPVGAVAGMAPVATARPARVPSFCHGSLRPLTLSGG